MKGTRTIKSWLSYGLAPLLLVVLSYSVYREVRSQPDLPAAWDRIRQSFFSPTIGWLIAALIGTFANWGLEAWKWKHLLKQTQKVSFRSAFRGVLTGVSFTLFTPNRIGEYLGRLWHLERGSRGAAVSLSVAGGIAQLIITCFFGLIAADLLQRGGYPLPVFPDQTFALLILKFMGWGMTIFLLVLYFSAGTIGTFLLRIKWLRSLEAGWIGLMKLSRSELMRTLFLSMLRYGVFLFQYYFLFRFFGVSISLSISFLSVSLLFMLLALVPGMALAELGIRGKLSLLIVGAFSTHSVGIVLAVASVWFINLILPAIAGGILMRVQKQV